MRCGDLGAECVGVESATCDDKTNGAWRFVVCRKKEFVDSHSEYAEYYKKCFLLPLSLTGILSVLFL